MESQEGLPAVPKAEPLLAQAWWTTVSTKVYEVSESSDAEDTSVQHCGAPYDPQGPTECWSASVRLKMLQDPGVCLVRPTTTPLMAPCPKMSGLGFPLRLGHG